MRLLYVASGITVPGSYGGATHTWEVAHGLAGLGHEVHVVARSPARRIQAVLNPAHTTLDRVHLHYLDLPKAAGLLMYPQIVRLVRQLGPDAVMERYYNLAGSGILAAHRNRIPSLLEVNALIVDPPTVFKRRLDDALGRPLQLWALIQCRMAARIVTPLHTTVPGQIARRKIVELPWGANVDRFQRTTTGPDEQRRVQLGIPRERSIVVFLGSFRAWHGVHDFVAAGVRLLESGENLHFLLVGDGPERAAAKAAAAAWRDHFSFVGSVPHDDVPGYLALAVVGVAPFNTAPHPALRAAGFFWSPLKIYEYMAMSVPVVTVNIPPLDLTVREGQEGALFREGDIADCAAAIKRVVRAPNRVQLGEQARRRVVEHFSWQQHCLALESIIQEMVTEALHG